jgi:hypothetical protein
MLSFTKILSRPSQILLGSVRSNSPALFTLNNLILFFFF